MTWKNRIVSNDGCFKIIGYIIGLIIGAIAIGFLFSLPIMWLWNWLMPTIFGLTKITWLQSWGLMILVSFLFRTSVTVKE